MKQLVITSTIFLTAELKHRKNPNSRHTSTFKRILFPKNGIYALEYCQCLLSYDILFYNCCLIYGRIHIFFECDIQNTMQCFNQPVSAYCLRKQCNVRCNRADKISVLDTFVAVFDDIPTFLIKSHQSSPRQNHSGALDLPYSASKRSMHAQWDCVPANISAEKPMSVSALSQFYAIPLFYGRMRCP